MLGKKYANTLLCYRNTEAHPFKRPKAGGDEIPRYYR